MPSRAPSRCADRARRPRRSSSRAARSRPACASRSSVVTTSLPCDRLAAELVERLVEDRREVRVRRREVVVERALEPGPRAADGRVADDVRGERAVRVAAEEERLAVDLALAVPREPPPRLEREDEPAVDRELGDAPDRVVLRARRGSGAAQVCQYVVMTTSTATSPSATYVSRTICRFIAARSPGSRRAGGARAGRSSRRCSCRRRRRTAA